MGWVEANKDWDSASQVCVRSSQKDLDITANVMENHVVRILSWSIYVGPQIHHMHRCAELHKLRVVPRNIMDLELKLNFWSTAHIWNEAHKKLSSHRPRGDSGSSLKQSSCQYQGSILSPVTAICCCCETKVICNLFKFLIQDWASPTVLGPFLW